MRRPTRRLIGVVSVLSASLLLGVVPAASGTDVPAATVAADGPSAGRPAAADPDVSLARPVHGAGAVTALGDQLDEAATANDMRPRELSSLLRADSTAWVSTAGAVYYADTAATTGADTARTAAPATASAPLDQTFDLHSKPGSLHTIFLDFDGADLGGTWWNTDFPALDTSVNGWDPAGNGVDVFSDDERALVQGVWSTVAEDFAPFDVDVTTADPGPAAIYHETMADTEYGVQVLIGDNPQANSVLCSNTCSGIAWRGGEATNTFMAGDAGYGSSNAAFVFPRGTKDPQLVAAIASHEVGHQMDLQHDGDSYGPYAYGHGLWAPIMGVAQSSRISQWSKGEYPDATNHEDDLAMIAGHLGLRSDESGPRLAEAAPVPDSTAYISSPGDRDTYLLGRCAGSVDLAATTAQFANLDIELTLRDASGAVVATDDPPSDRVGYGLPLRVSGLDARIARPVTDGYYYLTVDGVGNGDWATGYGDYGSLGAYTLAVGSSCDGSWPTGISSEVTNVTVVRPDDLVANKVTVSWTPPTDTGASALTGYVLLVGGGVVDLPADATSYTWSGLGYSTPYTFKVVALNDHGPNHGASADFTTPRQYVPPTAPTSIAAGYDPGSRTARVTWGEPQDDGGKPVTGYDVYLGTEQATSLNDVVSAPASDVLVASLGPAARSAAVPGIVLGHYNYLRVRAKNVIGSGAHARGVSLQPPFAPGNDDFSARTPLTGTHGSVVGATTYATGEPADPAPPHDRSDAGDSSVWFSWTAPASRVVTVGTAGGPDTADIDTTLGVYTGSSLDALEPVVANDDRSAGDRTSRVRFDAVAGTTYAIAVDGYRGEPTGLGGFALTWRTAAATDLSFRATPIANNRVRLSTSVNPGVDGSGSPVGSVEFREDGALVGTVPVELQQADLALTSVVGGEHTYTAVFVPDDTADWAPAASGAKTVKVLGSIGTPDFQATVVDDTVTLAATFGAGATGQVRFRDGATTLDTVDVVDGVAVLAIDPAPEGTHGYVADYLPDTAEHEPATSVVRTVTVRGTTTATVAATVERATVTVEVTVAGRAVTPTGMVELREGTRSVADPAQVIGGKARFVLGQIPAGEHTWTATYLPAGEPFPSPHAGSTGSGTFTVDPWATQTRLFLTSPTPTNQGASLTAQVQNTVTGGNPAGTVEFRDGDQKIATVDLAGGMATHSISVVRPGTHSYTATYVPAAPTAYAASASAASTPFSVTAGTSSLFLSPTVTGHQVLLDASITTSLGTPEGTVELVRDGAVVQTLEVAQGADATQGRARFVFDDVPSGTYGYTATYHPADTLHTGSTHTQSVTVNPNWTDIGLQVGTDPTRRAHVLTARVSAQGWTGLPAGAVTFYDGPLQVGAPVPVVDGVAVLDHAGVSTGAHGYRATFIPTSFTAFNPSSTPGLQSASMALSPTTTGVVASAEGQTVTLRASVGSDYQEPNGGTVTFTDDGVTIANAMVGEDGVATRVLTGVQPGDHTYAATFHDDGWQPVYADSASDPAPLTVAADPVDPEPTPVATSTALSASAAGRTVTLDASVAGGAARSGVVFFYDGDLALDLAVVSGGSARLVLSDVAVGAHHYRAQFLPGDPTTESASMSEAQDVTVQPTPTTTVLRGAAAGTSVTLTATVSGGSAAYLVGSVGFYDGARLVASYALAGGGTAVVVVPGSVGGHSYRAEFVSASPDVAGSSSSSIAVTVDRLATKTVLTAPKAAKAGSRPTVTARVTRAGGIPGGKVTLVYGKKKVTLTLKAGKATYQLPKLAKGTLKLKASYAGDASSKPSSASAAVAVRK